MNISVICKPFKGSKLEKTLTNMPDCLKEAQSKMLNVKKKNKIKKYRNAAPESHKPAWYLSDYEIKEPLLKWTQTW